MNIKSSIGYSPTIPPMLNNSRDIMNAKQNMKKVKNMMVAVTASWCGACHGISDDLNKAIRDPANTSPGTRIDEKMLGNFNKILKKPIEPPHFPYFIVIDENGNLKEVLETMEAVKQFLKRPRSSSGMPSGAEDLMAQPYGPSSTSTQDPGSASPSASVSPSPSPSASPSYSPSASPQSPEEEEAEEEALQKTFEAISFTPNESGLPTGLTVRNQTPMGASKPSPMISTKPSPMKMKQVTGMPNFVAQRKLSPNSLMETATPPSLSVDKITPSSTSSSVITQGGGCLYSSLAATAYQLAPPAVLLGLAAATLKRKQKSRTKRRLRA